MLEWIIIGGLVVALYISLYRYEKKIQKMQDTIDEHHDKITKNQEKIDTNKDKLDEHYNHIEKLWVTFPKKE